MSDVNQAPRGQQYGQRKKTEAALDAIPMPDATGVPAAPEQPSQAPPDPMQQAIRQASGWEPPTGIMNSPEIPQTGGYTPRMPQANRDAIAFLPLMPGLAARAASPHSSESFRRWYRRIAATIPPELTAADAARTSPDGNPAG